MVGIRGARRLSRAEPRHGLAVCGRPRPAPAEPDNCGAIAHPHFDRPCSVGRVRRCPVGPCRHFHSFPPRAHRIRPSSARMGRLPRALRVAHRHRVRFGMKVGQWGLAAWSFLMATAHSAGLMLWPVLVASCVSTNSNEAAFGTPFPTVLAGVGVHTLAMLLTTAFVAVLIYEWIGLSILRKAWLNVDLLWVFALLVTGGLLLAETLR